MGKTNITTGDRLRPTSYETKGSMYLRAQAIGTKVHANSLPHLRSDMYRGKPTNLHTIALALCMGKVRHIGTQACSVYETGKRRSILCID